MDEQTKQIKDAITFLVHPAGYKSFYISQEQSNFVIGNKLTSSSIDEVDVIPSDPPELP